MKDKTKFFGALLALILVMSAADYIERDFIGEVKSEQRSANQR